MTQIEQVDTAAPDSSTEREIEFRDRKMWIKMPTADQLVVWQRILRRLQGMQGSSWSAPEVLDAMERLRRLLDTLLVNKVDSMWIDDQTLDGALHLADLEEILVKTIEAFGQDKNRAEKRAAKKATRRKATT